MRYLALNLLLAIIWMLLTGRFTLASFGIGAVVGFLAVAVLSPVVGGRSYVRAVRGILRLAWHFVKGLVLANLQLARDVLRPEPPFSPGIVMYDARDLPAIETVLLCTLVSLTPGTLVIDTEENGAVLFLHALHADDPERIRAEIRAIADLIQAALGPASPP